MYLTRYEPGKGIGKVEVEASAGVPETPEEFIARRDKEISDWLSDKEMLASIKESEGKSRGKVAATLFPNPHKGTNRYHLNGGYAIKMVHTLNYTLGDKDKVDPENPGEKIPVIKQVHEVLSAIAQLGERGAELANTLVKWKPELDPAIYESLNTENNVEATTKSLIDAILTVKPGTPQLTFETPKEKK